MKKKPKSRSKSKAARTRARTRARGAERKSPPKATAHPSARTRAAPAVSASVRASARLGSRAREGKRGKGHSPTVAELMRSGHVPAPLTQPMQEGQPQPVRRWVRYPPVEAAPAATYVGDPRMPLSGGLEVPGPVYVPPGPATEPPSPEAKAAELARKLGVFLEALRGGERHRAALAIAGLEWREVSRAECHVFGFDEEYKAALEIRKRIVRMQIDDAYETRALEGWEEPVWYQGQQCGTVRRFSDGLLGELGRANNPEKYSNKLRVQAEHSGKDGGPVQFVVTPVVAGSVAEWEADVKKAEAANQPPAGEPPAAERKPVPEP